MAETNCPLLVFPAPARAARARRFGGGSKAKIPDAASQATRLEPQFQRLQKAMDRQCIALQDNPLGMVPEQVLVLETVGSIQNFINVVRDSPGLEWLGEYELEEVEPDYGFEDETRPNKVLKAQFCHSLTAAALPAQHDQASGWDDLQETPVPGVGSLIVIMYYTVTTGTKADWQTGAGRLG